MPELARSQRILPVYSLFLAISAILVLRGILSSPSEPGNALLIGLSLPRLGLATLTFIAFAIFAFMAIKASRDQGWADRYLDRWFGGGNFSLVVVFLAGISLGLGWIGCFLPSYRVGGLANYWINLRPLMVFILLTGIATLTVVFIQRGRLGTSDLQISKTYRGTILLFLVALLICGVMFYSGFGVRHSDDFWYGAGVPILASQLITAILGGIFFLLIEKRLSWVRADLMVFLLIYLVTAIFWMREPLQNSFLFPGPYPPNRALYPFVDSAIFDTASQFALIGQGISNGGTSERSLYISFLVYLHSLFGQNYETLMTVQAGIFALFPGLIYLIGRSLESRAVGFASAIVAALRGVNSIAASSMIDLANPKMILTDFPTAIGIAWVILLTCEWLKTPERRPYHPLWIGGAIGFTLMLRTNPLILLFLIPLYALFRFLPDWKKWLVGSLLIFAGLIAITLPWELRNQARGEMIYSSYMEKFQDVIKQRYVPPQPEGLLPLISLNHTRAILSLSQNERNDMLIGPCDTVVCFAPNHFLHNIVTSILILPTSPILGDLRHTVRDSFPYWQPDWNGSFTTASAFFLVLNLFLIALGIGRAWDRLHMAGIAPLAVFVFYNLSNAFARTSGARYLVPMDWIVSLYFLIGVFQFVIWLANQIGMSWKLFSVAGESYVPPNVSLHKIQNGIVILIVLFGLGSLVPIAETFQNQRYQNPDAREQLTAHRQEIIDAGLDMKEINSFLRDKNAGLLIGRVLYPRHYQIDRGEILFYPFVRMGFPRTAFTLIGPKGQRGIVLPGDAPKHLPHAVDALVLGCREKKYFDALIVIVLDEAGGIYTRAPESDLKCPLRQPVCDGNRFCY